MVETRETLSFSHFTFQFTSRTVYSRHSSVDVNRHNTTQYSLDCGAIFKNALRPRSLQSCAHRARVITVACDRSVSYTFTPFFTCVHGTRARPFKQKNDYSKHIPPARVRQHRPPWAARGRAPVRPCRVAVCPGPLPVSPLSESLLPTLCTRVCSAFRRRT